MAIHHLRSYCSSTTELSTSNVGNSEKKRESKWFTLPPFAKTINASEMGTKLAGKPHLKSDSTTAYETTALKLILKCCQGLPRSLVRRESITMEVSDDVSESFLRRNKNITAPMKIQTLSEAWSFTRFGSCLGEALAYPAEGNCLMFLLSFTHSRGLAILLVPLGKPLYTGHATTLKKQLEYAEVCIEVGAKIDISDSVMVELGEGRTVNVDVEIVWKATLDSIQGVSDVANSFGDVSVQAEVVSDSIKNAVDSIVQEGVVTESDQGDQRDVCDTVQSCLCSVDVMGNGLIGVSLDVVQTEPLFRLGTKVVSAGNGQASSSKCPVLGSPNSFGALSPEVEDIEVRGDSPRKGRVVVEGVVELMQQSKPKTKKQGKGGKQGKGKARGGSPNPK
ncbi:hypothetical protein V6N13_085636 [Hibiscus sabdariffa]